MALLLTISLLFVGINTYIQNKKGELTISDFDFLEPGISYQAIVDEIEFEPEVAPGGGAPHVYTYMLTDDSGVYMAFSNLNSLFNAIHAFSDGRSPIKLLDLKLN